MYWFFYGAPSFILHKFHVKHPKSMVLKYACNQHTNVSTNQETSMGYLIVRFLCLAHIPQPTRSFCLATIHNPNILHIVTIITRDKCTVNCCSIFIDAILVRGTSYKRAYPIWSLQTLVLSCYIFYCIIKYVHSPVHG